MYLYILSVRAVVKPSALAKVIWKCVIYRVQMEMYYFVPSQGLVLEWSLKCFNNRPPQILIFQKEIMILLEVYLKQCCAIAYIDIQYLWQQV